ncbi:hypothetical protein MHYP_G00159380 [Metynnis hypsauchen]
MFVVLNHVHTALYVWVETAESPKLVDYFGEECVGLTHLLSPLLSPRPRPAAATPTENFSPPPSLLSSAALVHNHPLVQLLSESPRGASNPRHGNRSENPCKTVSQRCFRLRPVLNLYNFLCGTVSKLDFGSSGTRFPQARSRAREGRGVARLLASTQASHARRAGIG